MPPRGRSSRRATALATEAAEAEAKPVKITCHCCGAVARIERAADEEATQARASVLLQEHLRTCPQYRARYGREEDSNEPNDPADEQGDAPGPGEGDTGPSPVPRHGDDEPACALARRS